MNNHFLSDSYYDKRNNHSGFSSNFSGNATTNFGRNQRFNDEAGPSRRVGEGFNRQIDGGFNRQLDGGLNRQVNGGSSRQVNESGSKFDRLKATLLREGRLFEDPEFPAGGAAITRPGGKLSARNIVWKRPREIVKGPKFIYQDASRFDLHQGQLKNCWFIAATACLAASSPKLLRRCVPPDQEFDDNYAGIFRFNFWFYDQWVEIVIDDRLPTVNGRLLFGSNNSQPQEMWVPLFEKAYAKLYGCYENLEGGFMNNAVVDFTGGVSEMIDIRKYRDESNSEQAELYDMLYSGMQKSSLLGCHIEASQIPEQSLPNGLYSGHAYSITNLVKLKIRDRTIRLMRLRNPWGKGEWTGAWRDTSPEWNSIPEKVRNEVGMTVKEDGEFWMSFEDWLRNFEFLTLCHLSPDAVTVEHEADSGRQLWEEEKFHSEWIKGFSAGGCGNPPNEALFWRNPQFGVTVEGTGPRSTEKCHMVISLIQKSLDMRFTYAISLFLYQLREGVQMLTGHNYTSNSVLLAKSAPTFTNVREVTVHYDVPPGNYIVIPCTFNPNESIGFLLRVYTEAPIQSRIMDVETQLTPPIQPREDLLSVFQKYSNGENKMDAQELNNALNYLLAGDGGFTSFGIETARCLLSMIDKDKSGLLSVDEFRRLITELRAWKDKFERYDNDRSGTIDTYELVQLFDSIGFRISRKVQQSIIRRYGGKSNRLSLNDFLHCVSKLISLNEQFLQHSNGGGTKSIQLTLEDFLSTTLYF